MEILSSKQVADGKWEKSGDGYVLRGTPKDFGPPPDSEKAKAAKKAYEAAQTEAGELAARFPLRMDPKLRAKVPVVGPKPQLDDLLEQLRTATELKMTLADNLTYHDPKFVELQGGHNATAWIAMGLIARTDLDDGRWEKIEGGYRLVGVSRSLRPRSVSPWAWTAIGFAAVLIAAGAFLAFRGRGKKSPANPPSERSQ